MIGPGRLLLHVEPEQTPGSATWNMAVDQAISESVGAEPTLRFYTWSEPTLSLGYFQSAAESSPRFDSLKRVRRSTGGGAILHHRELTYSLTIPSRPGEHGARDDLYQGVHRAIADVLHGRGVTARPHRLNRGSPTHQDPFTHKDSLTHRDPFLCFQRRTDEDLVVGGYKVCGSAQRRGKAAILQHGSLLLQASEHASELPGIFDLTSIRMDVASLSRTLADEIGRVLGRRFASGELSSSETERARQIEQDRFASNAWWSRR